MNHDNRTAKRKLGDIGESIACDFLIKRGFEVIEQNYLRKWGEIDIITRKGSSMRFIEVKSVSCATLSPKVGSSKVSEPLSAGDRAGVTHATSDRGYRPEENVHPWKLRRLNRAIQTYLLENNLDQDWQLDLVTVKIDMKSRLARVELIENVNI